MVINSLEGADKKFTFLTDIVLSPTLIVYYPLCYFDNSSKPVPFISDIFLHTYTHYYLTFSISDIIRFLTSYQILPHPTTSYHVLPHPTTSWHILPHPTTSYHILPHPTTSYRGKSGNAFLRNLYVNKKGRFTEKIMMINL